NNTQDFVSFKTKVLLGEAQNDPIAKAGLVKDIIETIAKISDPIAREIYVKQCSQSMGMSEELLIAELNKHFIQKRKNGLDDAEKEVITNVLDQNKPEQILIKTHDHVQELEKEILRLLLTKSQIKNQEELTLLDFFLEIADDIDFKEDHCGNLILEIRENGLQTIEELNNERVSEIAEIIQNKHELSTAWKEKGVFVPDVDENPFKSLIEVIYRLKLIKIGQMINETQETLKSEVDMEKIDKTLNVSMFLKGRQKEIANRLGVVVLR
ncbi:MAG: hypothetical protein SNJ77_07490, partial [Cytophagales bacterium]